MPPFGNSASPSKSSLQKMICSARRKLLYGKHANSPLLFVSCDITESYISGTPILRAAISHSVSSVTESPVCAARRSASRTVITV